MDVHGPENAVDMHLYRAFRQGQLPGDRLIGKALQDKLEHGVLATRQIGPGIRAARSGRQFAGCWRSGRGMYIADQCREGSVLDSADRGRDIYLAQRDSAYRCDDLGVRLGAEEAAMRAIQKAAEHDVATGGWDPDEDAQAGKALPKPMHGLDALAIEHTEIEDKQSPAAAMFDFSYCQTQFRKRRHLFRNGFTRHQSHKCPREKLGTVNDSHPCF